MVLAIVFALICLLSITVPARINKPFPDDKDVNKFNILGDAEEFTLTDQDNRKISSHAFAGKIKVMGFIFTRCGMPEMCPLTTLNFGKVQKMLPLDIKDKTVLFLISFDPQYDSPDIMKKYGRLYKADFSNWHFLTGDQASIDKVLEDYNFTAELNEDMTYRHETTAFLIDQNDKVRKMYFLNMWTPDEVVDDIKKLLEE